MYSAPSMSLVPLSAGALFVVLIALLARRHNELFLWTVRDGRPLLIRGAMPRELEEALEDIARRAGGDVRVRALVESGRAVARCERDDLAQQVRNVLALHSLGQIRRAPRRPKNLGQWLGVEWLARAMTRR